MWSVDCSGELWVCALVKGCGYAGEGVQCRVLSFCVGMEVKKSVNNFMALDVDGGGLHAGLWVWSAGTGLRVWRARAQRI